MLRKRYLPKKRLNVTIQTNQPSININNSHIKNSPFYLFQSNDQIFNAQRNANLSRTVLDRSIFIDNASRIEFQRQVDYFYVTIRRAETYNYKGWENRLGDLLANLNKLDATYEDRLSAINEFQNELKPMSSTSKVLKKVGVCLCITATLALTCTAIASLMLIASTTMSLIGIAGVAMFGLTGAMKVTEELVNNSRYFKKPDRKKIKYGIFRDNEIKDQSKQDQFFLVARQAVYNC